MTFTSTTPSNITPSNTMPSSRTSSIRTTTSTRCTATAGTARRLVTPRPVFLEGGLPPGWEYDDTSTGDLRIVGALRPGGDRPVVTVRARTVASAPIEHATGRLMEELCAARPGLIVANCDLWPHPVWGVGRLVQTAYVVGETTRAHDVYVFVDGPREYRIEVACELVSLLAIEDQVATIVGRIRPRTRVGARRAR